MTDRDYEELDRLRGRCESPIEEMMLYVLMKYKRDGVTVECQKSFLTIQGSFRADLVLSNSHGQSVIECDGASFHKNYMKDLRRDQAILASGPIVDIWRLPGWAIFHREHSCVFLIASQRPDLFSTRALSNLDAYEGSKRPVAIDEHNETIFQISQIFDEDGEPQTIQISKRPVGHLIKTREYDCEHDEIIEV
jgi:very-short-patch-repair endonuclease